MKIGDIDVTNSLLNLEHDVNVLQQVLSHILSQNPGLKTPTAADVEDFKKNAIKTLQQKYPNMGIKVS